MYCEYLGLDRIGGWGAKSLALEAKSLALALALEAKSLALALKVKALALTPLALALALEFVALTPSLVIRIGNNYKHACIPLQLLGQSLSYAEKVKYIGIFIVPAVEFRLCVHEVKSKFFRSDWLTDWLYSHKQTLHINSDIANYNVQDRKE